MVDDPIDSEIVMEKTRKDVGGQIEGHPPPQGKVETSAAPSAGEKAPLLYALSLGLNMFLIDRLIFQQVTTIEAFFDMTSPLYALASILLSVLSAGIFGLTFVKASRFGDRTSPTSDQVAWLQIALAAILMILSIGCPVCGSPVLSKFGVEEGLGSFPLAGLELKLFSILLLWSSLRGRSGSNEETSGLPEGLVDGEKILDRPSPLKRIRPTLLPMGILLAVLSLPLLPATWKLDVSRGLSSEEGLSFAETSDIDLPTLVEQVIPEQGYQLNVEYGNVGPQLLESGAIDFNRFVERYEKGGAPLSETQIKILSEGLDEPIVIRRENAHFLLNFFWALGLTNKNPILEEGPMMDYSEGEIGLFASTGGWTLGAAEPTELYSSAALIQLSPDQQDLVERVAAVVYRPCCNNPTLFPDCNHGMAMLGLLELLAAHGAGELELMEAAKYFNAFWFPQQSLEVATYFHVTRGLRFDEIDPELVVGPQLFSSSGFQGMHAWLGENGLLGEAPNQGGSCGV